MVDPRIGYGLEDPAMNGTYAKNAWHVERGHNVQGDVVRWRDWRRMPPTRSKVSQYVELDGGRIREVQHFTRNQWDLQTVGYTRDWLQDQQGKPLRPRPVRPPSGIEKRVDVHAKAGSDSTRLETVQNIRHGDPAKAARDEQDSAVKYRIYKELEKRGLDDFARRLDWCGVITSKLVCNSCGLDASVKVTQCHLYHLCPTCARIRSRKMAGELARAVQGIKQVSGFKWRLHTYTLNSTKMEPRDALKAVVGAFSKLWRMHLKRPLAAAFRSIEFGPKGGKVHLHVLYYGPFIPKESLSAAWNLYTGGSYIIDLHTVQDRGNGMLDAIQEVTKYATKIAAVKPNRLVDWWLAMRGRHMTQRYGQLRAAMRPERQVLEEPDKCPHCGGESFTHLIGRLDQQYQPLSQRGPPRAHAK